MTATTVSPPSAGDAARRAVVVRAGAMAYLVFAVPMTLLAVVAPDVFALSRLEAVLLPVPQVLLFAGVAKAPWDRWLAHGWGRAALVLVVLDVLAVTFAGLALSDPYLPPLAALLVVVLAFSAAVLPTPEHIGIAALAVLGWVVLALSRAPDDTASLLLWSGVLAATGALLGGAAALASRAISTADQARREAQDTTALLSVAARATEAMSSLEVDRILDGVVRGACDIGADLAGVYVRRNAQLELEAQQGHAGPLPDRLPEGIGLVGRVTEMGRAVRVEEFMRDGEPPAAVRALGIHAGVGMPLWAGGRLAGVLVVGWTTVTPTGRQHEVLQLLASQAERALELADTARERVSMAERHRQIDLREDEFVTTVSHELRTPLTVVTGLAATLQLRWEDMAADDRELLLSRLRHNADELAAIVANLLDLARLQDPHVTSRFEVFDLARTITATADRLAPLFDDHDLRCHDEPGPLPVHGDHALIGRVVENLLANAARHTPAGTRVDVRTVALPADRAVRVEVVDDGPGIPPADRERIFHPFHRAGEAADRPRGLGIGLALAQEILRRHGSSLAVDEAPGGGAHFAFQLPAVVVARTQ